MRRLPNLFRTLFQPTDIRRDIGGLGARKIHVRHFGVGIEQKRGQPGFAETWPLADLLEGRRISIGFALSSSNDMARRAPNGPLVAPEMSKNAWLRTLNELS